MSAGRGDAERRLAEAGWHEGRRLDADAVRVRRLFEGKGYELDAAAEEFLYEYGDIVVPYQRNEREDVVDLHFEKACALADPEWVEHYASQVGLSLLPVGFANHEHLLIMRASDGAFYVAYDDYLALAGNSPLEMVEGILAQNFRPIR